MSKYGKFMGGSQLAEAQDQVARETKRRLEQMELGLGFHRIDKKMRRAEHEVVEDPQFYDDEEEEGREAQYETFYAQWQNLEQRVATLDERLESDWLALKRRITAVVAERRAKAAGPSDEEKERHGVERLVLERERARFDEEVARLKRVEAELAGRNLDAERAQLETRKQACFTRFTTFKLAPQTIRVVRDALRAQQARSLSGDEFRALTASLNLSALFASALAQEQQVYYGPVRHLDVEYVVLVASDGAFILVRQAALLV